MSTPRGRARENYVTPRSKGRRRPQTPSTRTTCVSSPSRLPLSPVSVNSRTATPPSSSQCVYQDECFTPKRSLSRTPPNQKPQRCSERLSARGKVSPAQRKPRTREGDAKKTPTELGGATAYARSVQATCFTPKSSLKRSPMLRPGSTRTASNPEATSREQSMIDVIPPRKKWEIPRTPVEAQATRSAQPQERTNTSPPSSLPTASPPLPLTSPLIVSSPPPPPPPLNCSPLLSTTAPSPLALVSLPPNSSTPPSSLPNPVVLPPSSSTTRRVTAEPSPPIAVREGLELASGLPGQCNDNDLAYLERLANVRVYEQLQSQVGHLDKAIKSAAQQKEQLEHEALKINRDIAEMRAKYRETVSSVQELIFHPSTTETTSPTPQLAHSSITSPTPQLPKAHSDSSIAGSTPQLSKAHMTQLKRVHQLAVAQLERTDRELKNKLSEVNREREEVEAKIREQEATVRERRAKIQSQLRSIEGERADWARRVQQATREKAVTQEKLEAVQSKLAKLQVAPDPLGRVRSRPSRAERQKAEERLKRIIVRCDLYVQRHKMLKEMGIKGRRH